MLIHVILYMGSDVCKSIIFHLFQMLQMQLFVSSLVAFCLFRNYVMRKYNQ